MCEGACVGPIEGLKYDVVITLRMMVCESCGWNSANSRPSPFL